MKSEHAVHKHETAGLKLVGPLITEQGIVQIHHVVSPRNSAPIANGLIGQLRECAHGRAASLGSERRKCERVPPIYQRCRRAEQARCRKRALPPSAMPEYFDHELLPYALDNIPASIALRRRIASRSLARSSQNPADGKRSESHRHSSAKRPECEPMRANSSAFLLPLARKSSTMAMHTNQPANQLRGARRNPRLMLLWISGIARTMNYNSEL